MINYDQMGNPTNYISKDVSENDVAGALEYDGRQLVKATNGSEGYEYIYNENGLMTKKLVYDNYDIDSNGKLVFSDLQSTYTYYWNDSKLMGYTLVNSSDGSFFNVKVMYGADGEPSGYTITGDNDFEMGFFYTKNLQGDITGIYTLEGASCLLFSYDAYGTPTYTVGDSFIGAWLSLSLNPFYYRGYMYDINTGLYYLQSRFYNPLYGRFLNADETMMLHFTQGDVHGANLFAYCLNNPVMYTDPSGQIPVWVLYAAAGAALFGGVTYLVGRLLGISGWTLAALTGSLAALGGAAAAILGIKFLAKVAPKLAAWFQKVAKGTKVLPPNISKDGQRKLSLGGIVILDAFKIMFHPPGGGHNFFHIQIEVKIPGVGKRWTVLGRIKINPKNWFK